MRIGIDACTWANRRGYGRFTRGLVGSMVAEFPQHEFILVTDQRTANEEAFPPGATLHVVHTSEAPSTAAAADGSRRPLDLLRMGRAASQIHADVFLFPTSYTYFPLWGRTPVVTVFHDASAENYPTLILPRLLPRMLWRLKSKMAMRQSRRIVTVSGNARQQIASAFRRPASAIEVVSEGADPVFRALPRTAENDAALSDARRRFGLPEQGPLVLYVGGISPHKNLDGLLRAMSLPELQQAPWHLALVGDFERDNFLSAHRELVDLVQALGLGARVTFTGFVPDADLALLYNAATLFVLPSFSEGFGLPVLEAMSCGLPVVVSNRSSMPEIAGDAGRQFDPSSPADIARTIARVLLDESLRRDMHARGLARSVEYSWAAGARTMMRVLEEAGSATSGRRMRTGRL